MPEVPGQDEPVDPSALETPYVGRDLSVVELPDAFHLHELEAREDRSHNGAPPSPDLRGECLRRQPVRLERRTTVGTGKAEAPASSCSAAF